MHNLLSYHSFSLNLTPKYTSTTSITATITKTTKMTLILEYPKFEQHHFACTSNNFVSKPLLM